ncbi:MAG: anti-FecI sigma factor FecR, partial [Rhizorhabdus sp.]|nr:anti-FecI sigma factor FecR [Rhizorhabdus sp.]
PAPLPDNVVPLRRAAPTRRYWLGGALAASIAAMVGLATLDRADPYVIEAAAGVPRSVTLADGTRIDLNGGARITLDHNDDRFAQLDRGEAAFSVVHHEDRPFAVTVGDAKLVDIGTVFNVLRDDKTTMVGVAEGEVEYRAAGIDKVSLTAGSTLRAVDGDTQLVVGRTEPGGLVAWREGRLVYDGVPIAQVAADLSRNLGFTVSASPDIAARPFRGVISFDRDRDGAIERLAPVLDAKAERVSGGWMLTSRTR